MIKKSTIIIFAIMLVMIGGFILLDKLDALDFLTKPGEPTATPMPGFITVDAAVLKSIRLEQKGSPEIFISRKNDAIWLINVPGAMVSVGNIEEIISQFNALKPTVFLDIDLALSGTGLDDPTYIFTLEMSDGSIQKVKIGNANPTNTGYYAQQNIGQAVIIAKGGIDSIVEVLNTIATPPTPTPSPTSQESLTPSSTATPGK